MITCEVVDAYDSGCNEQARPAQQGTWLYSSCHTTYPARLHAALRASELAIWVLRWTAHQHDGEAQQSSGEVHSAGLKSKAALRRRRMQAKRLALIKVAGFLGGPYCPQPTHMQAFYR